MNYQKHYDTLIERARYRLLEGYVEKHHIIPKCMGGINDVENLVALTPEEHYVAHQLLVKIYPNEYKLVYAARMMTFISPYHSRRNKLYGWLKRKYSTASIGRPRPDQTKRKISEKLKGRTFTEEHKQNISKRNKGNVPWNKGIKIGPQTEEHKRKNSESKMGKPIKVTEKIIIVVQQLFDSGWTRKEIYCKFSNISKTTIKDIVNRRGRFNRFKEQI